MVDAFARGIAVVVVSYALVVAMVWAIESGQLVNIMAAGFATVLAGAIMLRLVRR